MSSKAKVIFVPFFKLGTLVSSIAQPERKTTFGDPIGTFPQLFADDGWDIGQGAVKAVSADNDHVDNADKTFGMSAAHNAMLTELQGRNGDLVLWTDSKGENPRRMSVGTMVARIKDMIATLPDGYQPEYRALFNYRRLYAIWCSAVAWVDSGEKRDWRKFTVPVQVIDLLADCNGDKDLAIRREDEMRVAENRRSGTMQLDPVAQLIIAERHITQYACNQKELGKLLDLTRHGEQTLHAQASLGKRLGKKFNLFERVGMDVPTDDDDKTDRTIYVKGGWIPLTKLTAAVCRSLQGDVDKNCEQVVLDAIKATGTKFGPDKDRPYKLGDRCPLEVAEKTVELVITKAGQKTASMDNKQLTTVAGGVDGLALEIVNNVKDNKPAQLDKALAKVAELQQGASEVDTLRKRVAALEKENASLQRKIAKLEKTPTKAASRKKTARK